MKKEYIVGVVALVVGLVLGAYLFAPAKSSLGGLVHIAKETFVQGLDAGAGVWVGTTQVVDSSGNWDGAVSGTTGTFSSTLAVTGTTTLSNGLTMTKSTGSLGCITFYATSSATVVKMSFVATAATSTYPGDMLVSYGACQ